MSMHVHLVPLMKENYSLQVNFEPVLQPLELHQKQAERAPAMKISWTSCSATKSTHFPPSVKNKTRNETSREFNCLRMFLHQHVVSRHVRLLFLNFFSLNCSHSPGRGRHHHPKFTSESAVFSSRERVIMCFVRARHDFNGLCWKMYLLRTLLRTSFSVLLLQLLLAHTLEVMRLLLPSIFSTFSEAYFSSDKGPHELLMQMIVWGLNYVVYDV